MDFRKGRLWIPEGRREVRLCTDAKSLYLVDVKELLKGGPETVCTVRDETERTWERCSDTDDLTDQDLRPPSAKVFDKAPPPKSHVQPRVALPRRDPVRPRRTESSTSQ